VDLAQALARYVEGYGAEKELFPGWKQRQASREIGRFMKAPGIARKNFHGKADLRGRDTLSPGGEQKSWRLSGRAVP